MDAIEARKLNIKEYIVWNMMQAITTKDYEIRLLEGDVISFDQCVNEAKEKGLDLSQPLETLIKHTAEKKDSIDTSEYDKMTLDKPYMEAKYLDDDAPVQFAPGDTLLHLAARYMGSNKNNEKNFDILVKSGKANPHIKNINGQKPDAVAGLERYDFSTNSKTKTASISWKKGHSVSDTRVQECKGIIAHNMGLKNKTVVITNEPDEDLGSEEAQDPERKKPKGLDAKSGTAGAVLTAVGGAGLGGGAGAGVAGAIYGAVKDKLNINMDVFYITLAAGVAVGALLGAIAGYNKGSHSRE